MKETGIQITKLDKESLCMPFVCSNSASEDLANKIEDAEKKLEAYSQLESEDYLKIKA